MASEALVSEYMSSDVEIVNTKMTTDDLKQKMRETGHNGFPVCSGQKLAGYVTARDIVFNENAGNDTVGDIMESDYLVFNKDVKIQTAGRIMFREGNPEVPVIDDQSNLVGLITNTDIIRSQIERTTPRKVESLRSMFSTIHDGIEIQEKREEVQISDLTPTQNKIYMDELEGRKYEMKKGLAEEIVAVRVGDKIAIADGHHRAVAADMLNLNTINAYILDIDKNIQLGLIDQAEDQGLINISDIEIISDRDHPQVEKIGVISSLSLEQ